MSKRRTLDDVACCADSEREREADQRPARLSLDLDEEAGLEHDEVSYLKASIKKKVKVGPKLRRDWPGSFEG